MTRIRLDPNRARAHAWWRPFARMCALHESRLMSLLGIWGQYVNWAGLLFPDDFYSNDTAKQLYKNHIQYLVNRRNGITRRLYKDEPAIFSW